MQGPPKGAETQAVGRSRGGLSSKIHLATDADVNPAHMIQTVGERNDITQIEALLDGFKADHVLADKGYNGACTMDAVA